MLRKEEPVMAMLTKAGFGWERSQDKKRGEMSTLPNNQILYSVRYRTTVNACVKAIAV